MKSNVIINGDCLEVLKSIPDNSIDLIFADPPYWLRVEGVLKRVNGSIYDGCDDEWDQFSSLEEYEHFTENWLNECLRVLKKDGCIWVIGGMQCIYTIGSLMQKLGFWFINDVIWLKKNPTPNFMGTRLNNSHETLIWATKSKKSKFTFHYKTAKELNLDTVAENEFNNGVRKQLGSVWKIAVCSGSERIKDDLNNKLHSTQKPEELLYRIIAISSNIGDTVLDPFGGTMTTAAVAKKLGRQYIMIEREKKYCKYGEQRIKDICFEDTPIARAQFDVKPLKVSISEMIKEKYFFEGELFYLKNNSANAILNDDGKLLFNGELMDMHSCAAKAKKSKSDRLNGFDYWYVMRDGNLVSISDIREQYRKYKASIKK